MYSKFCINIEPLEACSVTANSVMIRTKSVKLLRPLAGFLVVGSKSIIMCFVAPCIMLEMNEMQLITSSRNICERQKPQ
jgi:hypothetical protein